jgi:methionyl-tRNA synthetase
MALGLPLPRKFLCHAHWTLGHEKMSKSVGNVINPFDAMDTYGTDALRWYMCFDGGILDDADYSSDVITARYQNLKNVLGNFAARLTKSKTWNIQREVSKTFELGAQKNRPSKQVAMELFDAIQCVRDEVERGIEQANPRIAAQAIDRLITKGNASFAHSEPWKLGVKNDFAAFPEQGRESIYLGAESLRLAGILLQPFMPDKANDLLQILGVKPERRTWTFAEIGADDDYGQNLMSKDTVLFPPLE